jgi:hypothetical protein
VPAGCTYKEDLMAFPPNYRQARVSRSRGQEHKALEKQRRREEKSDQRKAGRQAGDQDVAEQAKTKQQE